MPTVRPLAPAHEAAAEALLDATVAGRHQARLGEVVDVLALPGAGAWEGDRLVGVVTWSPPGPDGRAELAVLAVAPEHQGRGWAPPSSSTAPPRPAASGRRRCGC